MTGTTKFQEVGAELIGLCGTPDEAYKSMDYSCWLCAQKGFNVGKPGGFCYSECGIYNALNRQLDALEILHPDGDYYGQ